jgi:2-keto-myo-inositol isomerase
MKIAFNETLPQNGLAEDLFLCDKYGYDYIELRIDRLKAYLDSHGIGELRHFFATHSIKPLSVNSVVDINFCDPAGWNRMLEDFIFSCMMCKELGAPYVVVVPTRGEAMQEKTREAVFADSVSVLRKLSDIAAVYGAKIAFEPMGNRLYCVRSIRQGWEIVKAADRENIGLTLDAFNLFTYDGLSDIEDLQAIPPEKIYVFHIDDGENRPVSELDPMYHRLLPGDGIVPVREFVAALRRVGFDHHASLEVFHPKFYEMDGETVIREGYEKTKAILEAV